MLWDVTIVLGIINLILGALLVVKIARRAKQQT
jgi:hypothetical protein